MDKRERWLWALAAAMQDVLDDEADWDDLGPGEQLVWKERAEEVLPRWQSYRRELARQTKEDNRRG